MNIKNPKGYNGRNMREKERAFIGKITAGISHEFMNALATIRESSGLIEDLLALDKTSFPNRERLEKTLATIRKHVNRGMEIGERLNTFAHSMDEPKARVNINDLLNQLVFLIQRFARLKQVQLSVHPIEPSLEIFTDPFRLQMILAACLEYCLDRTESGGVINLRYRRVSNGIAIHCFGKPFSGQTEDAEALPASEFSFKDALDTLNVRLLPLNTDGQIGVELILPFNI